MKTLFASDIHIGEQRRIADTEAALCFVAQTAMTKLPHTLVLLGDIFDKRRPTPREMQVFNKFLYVLRGVCDVLVLEGNHDVDRDISTLTYLQDLSAQGVKVVRPPYEFKGFYLGHEHIGGAQVGDGFTLVGGKSLDDIIRKHPKCSVFAFGDFHKPQVLRESPFSFYAGSIVKTTFAEKNDTKFLWLFEDQTLLEKIEIPGRRMVQYDINVVENVDGSAPWANHQEDLDGALVKIVYSGTRSALRNIQEDSVKRHLLESLKVQELKVEYVVLDKTRTHSKAINESATSNNVLSEYFKDKTVENKEAIIKAGEELLNE